MTVETEACSVNYSGDDATTDFAVPFPFAANAHLVVTSTTAAVDTVLTLGVDYTASGAGAATGTVTFVEAPASGVLLTIERVVPVTQQFAIRRQGSSLPAVHEGAYDHLTHVCQQLNRRLLSVEGISGLVPAAAAALEVELEFTTSAAVEDTFPLSLPIPDGVTPAGLCVVRTQNLTTGETVEGAVAAADFTFAAGTASLPALTGLEADTEYRVTFKVLTGDVADGTPPPSAWAVGGSGTILQWNGMEWSAATSGVSHAMYAVWGSSITDVWAVGAPTFGVDDSILHWDGASWAPVSTGGNTQTLRGVWGSSSTDVWAVGGSGTILHWNGASWSTVASGTSQILNGVHGISSSDAWAVGRGDTNPTLLHWNGSAWSAVSYTGTEDWMMSVCAIAANDVWAGGTSGDVFHWNGSAWATGYSGAAGQRNGFFALRSDYVWSAGSAAAGVDQFKHWVGGTPTGLDKTKWTDIPAGVSNSFQSIWGTSSSRIIMVGSSGKILHWNGSSLSSKASGVAVTLTGVWVGSP